MTRTKLGLLGLCAMLFGLMAFNATGAQAVKQWLFAEKAGANLIPFLLAEAGLEAETTGVLHTEILKIKVLFLCPTIKALNVKLGPGGTIEEGAQIDFDNCTTHLNGTTAPECEPKSGGVKGRITTTKGHGVLVPHKLADGTVDDLLSILPDEGETFATIETVGACPVGTKIPVIGKATLKDCEKLGLTHLVKHLIEVGSEAELTELWTISKTTEHKATILGSAWGFLIGAHEGIKFSGDPE